MARTMHREEREAYLESIMRDREIWLESDNRMVRVVVAECLWYAEQGRTYEAGCYAAAVYWAFQAYMECKYPVMGSGTDMREGRKGMEQAWRWVGSVLRVLRGYCKAE